MLVGRAQFALSPAIPDLDQQGNQDLFQQHRLAVADRCLPEQGAKLVPVHFTDRSKRGLANLAGRCLHRVRVRLGAAGNDRGGCGQRLGSEKVAKLIVRQRSDLANGKTGFGRPS